VFTDLAIWMVGFGLAIGIIFPPFCLLLGLPAAAVMTPGFYAATLAAGLAVGAVNVGLARLVVGRRLRLLAVAMTSVEAQMSAAVYTQDWSGCDPTRCALPVDSDDEVGDAARAFNSLIRTLARSHGVESAIREFSGVLSREYELEQLGSAALGGLLEHTGADAGVLLIVRDDELVPLASHGIRDVAGLATGDHVRRALRLGRLERVRVGAPELVVDSVLVGAAAREILVVPLVFKSVPLGALVLATIGEFTPDAAELLDLFGADLGLAVNNALAHDRLERLAAVDPLTDAYNRRFGLGRLREEYSRAVRAEGPFGVLMVDIDHFKAVNDTYGHLVGDRVLRSVCAIVRSSLREGDVLLRYGGEELLAVMPAASASDLWQMGERLRQAVEDSSVADGQKSVRVTLSAGGAAYPSQNVEREEGLVQLADEALYRAKEGGRNRVEIAT
jgi:diguanylate cyclase (GGDEF)-like protein